MGGLVKIADEAKLCKPICLTFEVKQKVGCTTYGWALLWRRIGPFLLTNFGCRHCSFQYVLSICGAYFSDVMVSPGFRSCSGSDQQQTTKQWKSDCDLFFFWCKIGFGKCFGTSSPSNDWAGHHRLSYNIHFSSHVIIQLKNGLLLLHRRRDDVISKQFSDLQSGHVFVQLFSHLQFFVTSWTAACQASLSFTIYWSLIKLISIETMMPSNHLILFSPLLLLPSGFPSIRDFSSESAFCIRWPNYWSFSISPSNEHLGLISFRIDWFDLLTVQGTLKSLLKHHSSKVSILLCSAFFMAQLSHTYMTTGNHSFDKTEFCQQLMSLLFNTLSSFVITFLSRSKYLLISWLQSLPVVIWKKKFSPYICQEVMGLDAIIFVFWM